MTLTTPQRWALVAIGTLLIALASAAYVIKNAWQQVGAQAETIKNQKVLINGYDKALDDTLAFAKQTSDLLSQRAENKARIVTVTKEIIHEVPRLIPVGTPDLPPGWRVLHDAAAIGAPPGASSGPDAAPVPAQAAAETVIENYGQYHDLADQLKGLQQWAINLHGLRCQR